jgi:YfiR/HmsC-like
VLNCWAEECGRAGGRLSNRWLGAVKLGILSLCISAATLQAQNSVSEEFRAKASFLASIPNFVEWPDEAFPSAVAPLMVCVLGEFHFGTALAELTRGVAPRGRRMEVRWVHKDPEARDCHMLFVSRSEGKRYDGIFQLLNGAEILTVGETEDFLSVGGVVSFNVQGDNLQFEVNLPAVNKAHLRMSSRMLALARRVVNSTNRRLESEQLSDLFAIYRRPSAGARQVVPSQILKFEKWPGNSTGQIYERTR